MNKTDAKQLVVNPVLKKVFEKVVVTNDGNRARDGFQHELITQEVKQVGGSGVLSIGYEELIAQLIKSVQELSTHVRVLESKQN